MSAIGILLLLGLIYMVLSLLKKDDQPMDSSVSDIFLRKRVDDLEEKVQRLSAQIQTLQSGTAAAPFSRPPMPASAPIKTDPTPMVSKPVTPVSFSCPKCWTPFEADAEFCDQCGASLKAALTPSPKKETPPSPVPAPKAQAVIWPPVSAVRPPAPIGHPTPNPTEPASKAAALHYSVPSQKSVPAVPIDWESFLGVKLFAWLGGFALFLGMAFFVKYSLDHNLISPWLRIAVGFVVGSGAIIGGLSIRRKDLSVTMQTLCAAGIAVLYADVYAARTLYDFLSPSVAFALMSFVTGLSFFLSVRLDSRFVAILGWLGGFLTPPMLSTGVDRPWALFGYVALLDMGLAAVVYEKKWDFLMSLGALATLAMEAGWTYRFLTPEKLSFALGLYAVFALFYAVASDIGRRRGDNGRWTLAPGALVPLASMGFVARLMTLSVVQAQPLLALALLIFLGGLASYAAVRRKEPFIALLGLAGAFVVPLVLSVQVNRLVMLFGYCGVLSMLTAFLAIRQRWGFLLGLGAIGTLAMEVLWTSHFLTPEKTLFAMGIYTAFAIFYVAVTEFGALWQEESLAFYAPGALLPIVTMGFAAYLLDWAPLAGQLIQPLIFLFILSVLTLFAAMRRGEVALALFGLGIAFALPMVSPVLAHTPLYFGTMFLFDLVLVAVALRRRWGSLIAESALGSLVMLGLWTVQQFQPAQVELLSGLVAALCAFFLGVRAIAEKRLIRDSLAQGPASLVPLFCMGAVGAMLNYAELAMCPGLVLGLLLILGVQLAYMAVKRVEARPVYICGGLISFLLLALWTMAHLRNETLYWGLGFYLAFGLVHTVFPFLLQVIRPTQKPFTWGYAAPLLMLVLILMSMTTAGLSSVVIWLFVGLLAMLALGAAYLAGSLIASGLSLALVMLCFTVGLFNLSPAGNADFLLLLLGAFGTAFFLWGLFVSGSGKLAALKNRFSQGWDVEPQSLAQFPALAALLPFFLLGMVCVRLSLPQPSLVFGVLALMTALLFALVPLRGVESLSPVTLGGVLLVQALWHLHNANAQTAPPAAIWYLGFYAAFSVFPFLCRARLSGTWPWITAALVGLGYFPFLHDVFIMLWGKAYIGVLPAGLAIAPLIGTFYHWPRPHPGLLPRSAGEGDSILAVYGGVGLFFLTLIIPLQFDKEVITLGWALEGAALVWLYRRIKHDGLKGWGVSLLLISFVRLALNPSVLSYHDRAGMPFMNWYLYVYGVTAVALFLAAYLLPKDRRFFLDTDMPPLLNSLGGILLFLLMNIEIADYFSTGTAITFNFSGNLAQDMAYSIGWGFFAISTLITGIRANSKGARYASLALLIITIFKVFLHDLWRLGGLFRVGSFIGLAIGLILVSFLYQRFLSKGEKHG